MYTRGEVPPGQKSEKPTFCVSLVVCSFSKENVLVSDDISRIGNRFLRISSVVVN